MQIIKYIMLLLLFITSALIGKTISNQYVYRLKELEEIKTLLNILKSKIKFTYEPIPEIFKEISEKTSITVSQLFRLANKKMQNQTASEAWESAVDCYSNNLKEEDKQALKTMSKLLRNNRH